MSKVWAYGKGWTDDKAGAQLQIPSDMPGAIQAPVLEERHLPRNWVLAVYGIPTMQAALRRRLCWVLKSHGLQSIDIGGSVYLGPANHAMDNRVADVIEKLRRKTGLTGLVKLFAGDYDEATAAMFLDSVTKAILEEMANEEQKIVELERALAGQTTIVNRDGKEQDLLTTGYGRIDSARKAVEQTDAVLARFQGNATLEAEGERLRTRAAQMRAWVQTVAAGFERFAAHERARRKQEEGAA